MSIVRFCQNNDLERFSSESEGLSAEISNVKRYGDDSYSHFLHKLKNVLNYYLESKQITEFQSLCDDMLLGQFRSVLPGEVGLLWISAMSLRLRRWRN